MIASKTARLPGLLSKKLRRLVVATCLLALPAGLWAQETSLAEPAPPFTNFSAFNAVYLYGANWDLGADEERDVLTLEYFSDWRYGDTFTFIDISNINTESAATPLEFYGEFSPRLSFSKIRGEKVGFGPVKDILLSSTLEMGSNPVSDPLRALIGLGFQLDVPVGAASVDVYYRDDTDFDGSTWQVTLAWLYPFELIGQRFTFSGFVDFAGDEGPSESNIVAGPRLTMDASELMGLPDNTLQVGTEIAIWQNEFGIDGQDEFVPQFAVQWSF